LTDGFTAELGRYVAAGDPGELPSHAVEATRQLVLDTVGVAFAGAREPVARKVASVVRRQGGARQSVVLGWRWRTSATGAALANGTAAHALDLDDSHHPGFLHPSAPLLPAVLALGEDRAASGAGVVAAYLYGLDTIAAVGSAINIRHYELGWHATATIGTLGAAAAAAKLLDLPAERTSAALALAASEAGGVRRNFGSMAKPVHAGLAAQAGVLAALLAEEGVTAGEAVLEGDRGFFDLVAGPGAWDADAGLRVLDHRFGLAIDGLGIKRFASCGVTHAPIEAMLRLREEHRLGPDDVASLELVVHPLAVQIARHDEPGDGLESKFSLPHCLAVALVDGVAGLAQFVDERVRDGALKQVRERVRIVGDPEVGLDGHMSFGCRLSARLADGRTVSAEVATARGKWVGERLTQAEIVEKFEACTAAAGIECEAADRCRELIGRLDELTDVRDLTTALFRAGGKG
jgi:2-methylcitrate dehydratase PrpD